MARGKHGQSAQAKADGRALARIRALEAEIAAERLAHGQTRVELQSARDHAASELLAAKRQAAEAATANLQSEIEELQAEIAERKRCLELVGASQTRLANFAKNAMREAGLTGVEAHERMLKLIGHRVEGDRIIDVSMIDMATEDNEDRRLFGGRFSHELNDDERQRLVGYQQARGLRHREDIPASNAT